GPSTSTEIVLVMGDGSQVSLLGDPQNGFYPVSYNGSTGWAFGEYLSVGGGEEPVPDDGGEEEPAPDPGDSGDVGNGDTNGDGSYTRDELVAIIEVAAARYGQPVNDMIRVAGCESVWDPRAVNSSSGASGLFQFMPGTWLTTPFADQDIFDPGANANAAAWMWSVGRRNEWSCQ
ncbi:MAG: transglycosylase SLT domain-containing protein, partial [Thermomicrobiales bacterium]